MHCLTSANRVSVFVPARRPTWVVGVVALLLLVAMGGPGIGSPAAAAAGGDLLVTVGDVTPTTALLWLSAPGVSRVELVVEPGEPAGAGRTMVPGADGRAVAELTGLAPGRRHRYRVRAASRSVAGSFVTAPARDDPAPVRVAWSGDLGARGHCRRPGGWPVFDAIAARRPDVFLFVGDTIYADHRCGPDAVAGADFVATTLEEFRAKHRYNRADPGLQRLLRATSVSAVWDDHEVRNNFTMATEPLGPIGLRAFLDYWPVRAPAGAPNRLHRRLRWGRLLELFILDTRQYRSAGWRRDGPGKTMLGDAQRRWLVEAVAASPARWKVIVSSVPLSIPKGWPFGDSWATRRVLGYETGYAHERDAILAALRARGVGRLVALAGDVHFGALMTHRPPAAPVTVDEAIAGPLAASMPSPRAPAGGLGTEVHFAHGGTATFGELDVAGDGATLRLFDGGGRLLAERALDEPVTVTGAALPPGSARGSGRSCSCPVPRRSGYRPGRGAPGRARR